MIAKSITLFSIRKIISRLNGAIFFLLIVVFFSFFRFFLLPRKEIHFAREKWEEKAAQRLERMDYSQIGKGALEIYSKGKAFCLPDIKSEVRLLRKNTRPDKSVHDPFLQLGLKGGQQTVKVEVGQKIYLSYVEAGSEGVGRLQFATAPTPLWIMPFMAEDGKAKIEFAVHLLSDTHESLLDERKEFEVEKLLKEEQEKEAKITNQEFSSAHAALEKAKWWGADRLFALYGGEEFEELKSCERIELTAHEGAIVLHLREKEGFVWKKGRWEKAPLGKETRGSYLAYVRTITPNKIEIDMWNESGFEKRNISLFKERITPLLTRMEEVCQEIRQRTSSRVSCRVNKKAMILKKGDWLFHGEGDWQIIKSLKEMEDVIHFQKRGELFIFEGIEKDGGKLVFSGTLFDSMRSQAQFVKVPLFQQKGTEHSSPQKKKISTKIRSSPEEEASQQSAKLKEKLQKMRRQKRAKVKE